MYRQYKQNLEQTNRSKPQDAGGTSTIPTATMAPMAPPQAPQAPPVTRPLPQIKSQTNWPPAPPNPSDQQMQANQILGIQGTTNQNLSNPKVGGAMTKEQKLKMVEDTMKLLEETEMMLKTAQEQKPEIRELNEKILKIIQGNLSIQHPPTSRVVRIFTSSTFTDTKHERNSWMEHAYPRVKEFCQTRGYEFQVVDMRWGIQDEAANDHSTVELCLQELQNCQRVSTGPNFISLLSHKYGYRPLNRRIETNEFETLLQSTEIDASRRELLKKWYIKDENACPSEYVLLPINRNIPDFLSKYGDRRKVAKIQWWEESEQMSMALRNAAEKVLNEKEAVKYTSSVTEKETRLGMLDVENANKHCIWFHRVIDDIETQPSSHQLSRFIECQGEENQVSEARHLQKSLQSKMSGNLANDNIHTYHVNWSKSGIDPEAPDHSSYLEQLTGDFARHLMMTIEAAIDEREARDEYLKSPMIRECVQHSHFCAEKLKGFHGRENVLAKVTEYIEAVSKEPLVIHGQSGCGKTSIMAAAAKQAWELVKDNKGTLILRFLGTTPDSSDIVGLLHSLVSQINKSLNMEVTTPARDLKLLRKGFHRGILLLGTRKDKKFIIILDSVDQLDASDDGRQVLSWLPKTLPPNVKVIISTLENKEYEAFPVLKAELPERSFVNVPDFDLEEATGVLDIWLQQKKRQLTPLQKQRLLEAFKNCPLPLFLKLSAEKAFQWTSFENESNIVLENTIKEAIHSLFASLEKKHGKTLVSSALGYITAAKIGLSESELEDILSCDDTVLSKVYQFWTPPLRRLPPLLTVRIRTDLQEYLAARGADGVEVLFWYHRQFVETAKERYLSDEGRTKELHHTLAEFFTGKWGNDNPKPYTSKDGENLSAVRYVAAQPIKFGATYNLRKLNNLPFHMTKAGMQDELKKECLLNFDFLLAKLESCNVEYVIGDFQLARAAFPGDSQIQTIGDTMYLAWSALRFDPKQLPSQFIDRLAHDTNVSSFVDQCRSCKFPYLKANSDLLARPGGQLIYTLPGHIGGSILGLDLLQSDDLGLIAITGGNDGTVKIWDVKKGQLRKSCGKFGDDVQSVSFAVSGTRIIADYVTKVVAFDLDGTKVYSFDTLKNDVKVICGDDDTSLVLIGPKETKIYSAVDGALVDTIGTPAEGKISLPAIIAASTNYVALTGDIQEKFGYLHLPTRSFSKFLKPKEEVEALAITKDEKTLIVADSLTGINFNFFAMSSLQKKRVIHVPNASFASFGQTPLLMSADGTFVYFSKDNYVTTLNLETEKVEYSFEHPQQVETCRTVDSRIWVTTSEDSLIRVWDSERSTGKSTETKKENDQGKIISMYPMKNTRYVLLIRRTKDDKQAIQVYDLATNKAVRQAVKKGDRFLDELLWDDQTLIVATSSRRVKKFDLDTLTITQTFQGLTPPNEVYLAFANGGKELLSQSRSRLCMKLYDFKTGKTAAIIKQPPGHTHKLSTITTNKAGTVCVCYTDDFLVLIYDLQQRTLLTVIRKQEVGFDELDLNHPITTSGDLAVIQGSKVIKGGNYLQCGILWDIQGKVKKFPFFDQVYHLLYQTIPRDRPSICFSESCIIDNSHFVAVCEDGLTRVWDLTTGVLIKRLPGHMKDGCMEMSYAEGGAYFVTYSNIEEENALRIWSKETWECLASFRLETCLHTIQMLSDGKSFMGKTPDQEILHFKLFNHETEVELSTQPELFKGDKTVSDIDFESTSDDTIAMDKDDPDQEEDEKESDIDDDDDDDLDDDDVGDNDDD